MANILMVGGDNRQLELCTMLKERGHNVALQGFGQLEKKDDEVKAPPDYVFLPVPYRVPSGHIKAPFASQEIYLADIYGQYPQSVYVLGGCDSASEAVLGGKVRCLDLLADEAFLVRNALLTAQAAVCAFEKESHTALCDLRCVVIGFGRIGKLLCRLLAAHGAQVTATARKPGDLEFIRAEGYKAIHTRYVADALKTADVVWNTVPVHVLDEQAMDALHSGTPFIELASSPYGMDMETAKKRGVCVRLEQGLPGRYFPVSAARAILDVFEREEQ